MQTQGQGEWVATARDALAVTEEWEVEVALSHWRERRQLKAQGVWLPWGMEAIQRKIVQLEAKLATFP